LKFFPKKPHKLYQEKKGLSKEGWNISRNSGVMEYWNDGQRGKKFSEI
jgi:hypothetical protein